MSALSADYGGRKTLSSDPKSIDLDRLNLLLRRKGEKSFLELKEFLREYIDSYEGTTDMLVNFFMKKVRMFLESGNELHILKYIHDEWDNDMVKLLMPSLIIKNIFIPMYSMLKNSVNMMLLTYGMP